MCKYKRVRTYIFLLILLLLWILYIIDGYSIYTIQEAKLENYSFKIAEKQDMVDAKVIKISDQGYSKIIVLEGKENYGIFIYNKSILYNNYKTYRTIFTDDIKEKGFYTAINDPINTYVLTLNINQSNDIS